MNFPGHTAPHLLCTCRRIQPSNDNMLVHFARPFLYMHTKVTSSWFPSLLRGSNALPFENEQCIDLAHMLLLCSISRDKKRFCAHFEMLSCVVNTKVPSSLVQYSTVSLTSHNPPTQERVNHFCVPCEGPALAHNLVFTPMNPRPTKFVHITHAI